MAWPDWPWPPYFMSDLRQCSRHVDGQSTRKIRSTSVHSVPGESANRFTHLTSRRTETNSRRWIPSVACDNDVAVATTLSRCLQNVVWSSLRGSAQCTGVRSGMYYGCCCCCWYRNVWQTAVGRPLRAVTIFVLKLSL